MTPADTVRWEVTSVRGDGSSFADQKLLEDHLAQGWEPFAATQIVPVGFRIHLRRAFVLSAMTSYEDYRDPEEFDGAR